MTAKRAIIGVKSIYLASVTTGTAMGYVTDTVTGLPNETRATTDLTLKEVL